MISFSVKYMKDNIKKNSVNFKEMEKIIQNNKFIYL